VTRPATPRSGATGCGATAAAAHGGAAVAPRPAARPSALRALLARLVAALPVRPSRLVLGGLIALAVALAAYAVVSPGSVDWGAVSFCAVAALAATALALYGARDASAQELSLVASLAALATASRVLFAGLPNVKPVTFVVLVSGVALGPAPGFMVGATSALVSNVFFGQGPWTPWQMLAWGGVGIVGGLLGRGSRTPRRWELVAAGAALALAFDWFVTLWMYIAFTVHSWPALVALYARGLPFDVAHVAATALFAGLFGVQAVRIVARFRVRTRVKFVGLEDPS
jgi:energy-coupling factor transport system substrate-specific component